MTMKRILFVAFCVVAFVGGRRPGLAILPDIPRPKLSATQAMAIAERLGTPAGYTLVAVDWCKASDFKPRYSDGTQWSPGSDHPDDYSWFLTYVFKDADIDRVEKSIGVTHEFNSVAVVRIEDDGQRGALIGWRS